MKAFSKAVIVNVDEGKQVIPVMFNPPSYQLTRSNHYEEVRMPGQASVMMEYVSGVAGSLSTTFFFDTTATGIDVREHTRPIENLLLPHPRTKAPPQLNLMWGSLVFSCCLDSVQSKFDYFNSAGVPLRATLDVVFKGQEASNANVNAEPARTVRVKTGQKLHDVAQERYKDPAKWRAVAEANDIDNPRQVAAGTALNLPRVP